MVELDIERPLREKDLTNAWLWTAHKHDLQWRRVRLGMVPTKEMAAAYLVILRWIDAIVYDGATVFLVEAKLRPSPGVIGQLEHYNEIFTRTSEFEALWEKPRKMVLLTTVLDVEMMELCGKKNIDYELFTEDDIRGAYKLLAEAEAPA